VTRTVQPAHDDSLDAALTVRIGTGLVRGVRVRGVRAWRGIPYAAAPVGPLRFRAPQPPEAWPGVRDASDW